MVCNPGGYSFRLCGCLFQGERRALLRRKLRLGLREENRGWNVLCLTEDCIVLFHEGLKVVL